MREGCLTMLQGPHECRPAAHLSEVLLHTCVSRGLQRDGPNKSGHLDTWIPCCNTHSHVTLLLVLLLCPPRAVHCRPHRHLVSGAGGVEAGGPDVMKGAGSVQE